MKWVWNCIQNLCVVSISKNNNLQLCTGEGPEMKEYLIKKTNQKTTPFIFIDQEFVGGFEGRKYSFSFFKKL